MRMATRRAYSLFTRSASWSATVMVGRLVGPFSVAIMAPNESGPSLLRFAVTNTNPSRWHMRQMSESGASGSSPTSANDKNSKPRSRKKPHHSAPV